MGGRLAANVATTALMAWMALGLPTPSLAASDVTLSARPMFGPAAKVHNILPLRIDLRTRAPFEGRLAVEVDSIPETRVEIPLHIGPGQFQYDIPLPVSRNSDKESVIVQLLNVRSRSVAEREVEVHFIDAVQRVAGFWDNRLIGWVGQDAMAMQRGFGFPTDSGVAVSGVSPDLLPVDPRLYDAVDALVVPGPAAAKLTVKQVDAIERWVRSGGRLLLDGGGGIAMAKESSLFQRFSVVPDAEAREVDIRQRFPGTDRNGRRTNNEETVSLTLRPVSIGSLKSQDEQSLRVEMPLGLGCVVGTCVDLTAMRRTTAHTASGNALLHDILYGKLTAKEETMLQEQNAPYYDYSTDWGTGAPRWASMLFRLTSLEAISKTLVVCYLLLFAGVVCPLEWFLLRRLNLLRWSWWVTLATVMAFSLAAGLISLASRGTQPRRSTICIHDYAADGGGRHTLFDCFIPSRSPSVTARLAAGDVVRDVTSRELGTTAQFNLQRGEVEFTAPVWSPHFFLTTRLHDEPAPFVADLRIRNGAPQGTVQFVGKGGPVQEAWLAWSNRVYALRQEKDGRLWRTDGAVLPAGPPWDVRGAGYDVYAATRETQKELREQVLHEVRHLDVSGTNSVSLVPRGLFQGSPVGVSLGRTADRARLIAVCDRGESLDIEAANPRQTAIHVVRQIVPIER